MRMRVSRAMSVAITVGLVFAGGAALAGTPQAAKKMHWTEGATTPSVAARWDGARVGGNVYFLGYRADDTGTTDGSIWVYNIKKKKFTDTKVDMPDPISNYQIAVLKDKTGVGLYTFGGRDANGAIVTDVQVFYPATKKVKIIKSDPWPGMTPSECVSMPGTGVTVAGNKAYVLGGQSYSSSVPACTDDNSNQAWSFNPTAKPGKKWTQLPNLKVAAGYITAVAMGKTIYAIGGNVNDAGTLTAMQTVEAWKVGAKAWNDKKYADLPEACDESQGFGFSTGPLAGTITVAACGQWPNAIADVLQYNVAGNKWTTVGQLNEARRNAAGESIGSAKKPALLLVGGYNSDASALLDTSEIGTLGKSGAPAGRIAAPFRSSGAAAF